MTDSTLEIQVAVLAKLLADSAVTALVGTRIYDTAPQEPTYPFVEFGNHYGEPWEARDMDGWRCFFEVECWTRDRSKVVTGQIAAAVKASLHRQVLSLSTQDFVLCNHLRTNTIGDPDKVTAHALLRFGLLTHPPAGKFSPAFADAFI